MGCLVMLLEKPKSIIFNTHHLFFLGTLLNQGDYGNKSKGYVKLMITGWWMFSISIAAFFSGKIVADLTVHKTKYPFETMKDLIDHKDYTLIFVGDAYYEAVFRVLIFEFPSHFLIHYLHLCRIVKVGYIKLYGKNC